MPGLGRGVPWRQSGESGGKEGGRKRGHQTVPDSGACKDLRKGPDRVGWGLA